MKSQNTIDHTKQLEVCDEIFEYVREEYTVPSKMSTLKKSTVLNRTVSSFEKYIGTGLDDFLYQYQNYSKFSFSKTLWKELQNESNMSQVCQKIMDLRKD